MTDVDWHASPALLARFVHDPAGVDDMAAVSIEAHLVACAECRGQLTEAADPAFIADSWAAVADLIDRPRASLLERLLDRVGISSGTARLLGATPALRAAGLTAAAVVAAGAVVLSRTADARGPFLVLAPLAPLLAVAASFAPTADPGGEAGVGTPLHGAALVVRRAIAIVATSFAALGAAALALPDLGPAAAAWVLPALALAVAVLALGTWLRLEVAVGVLASGWLLMVWSLWWIAGHDIAVADTIAFAAVGQVAAVAVAAAAATVVVARRDQFATLEAFR